MALPLSAHLAQLHLFLQIMVAEGLVDSGFLQLQTLKASCGRDFVVRTIISYWSAARNLFTQMSNQLIGAVHVSIACSDIFNGCNEYDKDRCINALSAAKREFARLQVKFESVVELERNIIECEDMQNRGAQIETNPCELPR